MNNLDNFLDRTCLLPKLDFDNILKNECKNGIYRPIVINTPTGTGKTSRMLQFMTRPGNMGVVFLHSNEIAEELKERLINEFGISSNEILIFNSNQEDYNLNKFNPDNFNNYRWIICYAARFFTAFLTFFMTYNKFEIENLIKKTLINKYLLLDECISTPQKQEFSYAEITEFLNLAKTYNCKNPIHSVEDLNDENIDNFQTAILELIKSLDGSVPNNQISEIDFNRLLRLLANKGIYNVVINNPSYNDKKKATFLIYHSFFLASCLIRSLKTAKKELSETGKWIAHIGIEDIATIYPIIAFDGTADINYGKGGSFKVINLKDLIPNYQQPEDCVKINILPFKSIPRDATENKTQTEWKKISQELSNILKDDSIILWTKNTGKKKQNSNEIDRPIETEKLINDLIKNLGLKNCHFIYYGSSDIKGTNKFKDYKNVYILSEFFVHKNHLFEHQSATGNNSYSTKDRCLADILQVIGRTHLRNLRKNAPNNNKEKINLYFCEDMDIEIVKKLKEREKGSYNLSNKDTCKWYLENILKSKSKMKAKKIAILTKYFSSKTLPISQMFKNDKITNGDEQKDIIFKLKEMFKEAKITIQKQ